MKVCVKCRKIYGADLQFCTADGSRLINGDFCERNTARLFLGTNFHEPSQPTIAIPIPMPPRRLPETATKSKLNSRIALIGLLTAIILLSGSFVWTAIRIVAANRPAIGASPDRTAKNTSPAETDEPLRAANAKAVSRRQETVEMRVADVKKPETNTAAKTPKRHQFNGRVIMLNAVLRTAPTMEADVRETLPLDEPLTIGKRAAPNSPWYRVETASGAKGWMHGGTIEFVN